MRNPNYFKKGLPYFDGMIFTIVRDYNRRLAAMQVGQAQTTEGPTIGSYGNEDPMRIQRETKGKVTGHLHSRGHADLSDPAHEQAALQ